GSRRERRLVLVADGGVIELRRVERAGLRAGGAEGGAKAEAVDDGHVKPRLFAQHPRTAELRIVRGLELRAERAVIVATQRSRHEHAIPPRELLLAEHADGRIGTIVLRAAARRAAGDRRDWNRREVGSRRAESADVLMVVLQADGGREIKVC